MTGPSFTKWFELSRQSFYCRHHNNISYGEILRSATTNKQLVTKGSADIWPLHLPAHCSYRNNLSRIVSMAHGRWSVHYLDYRHKTWIHCFTCGILKGIRYLFSLRKDISILNTPFLLRTYLLSILPNSLLWNNSSFNLTVCLQYCSGVTTNLGEGKRRWVVMGRGWEWAREWS